MQFLIEGNEFASARWILDWHPTDWMAMLIKEMQDLVTANFIAILTKLFPELLCTDEVIALFQAMAMKGHDLYFLLSERLKFLLCEARCQTAKQWLDWT